MKQLCTLLACLSSFLCWSQPGTLDPSWNGKGWRQESFRTMSLMAPDVRDMYLEPNGSVLLQLDGDSPFSRHNADGTIDENYGYKGYAEPWQGNSTKGIRLQDGKQMASMLLPRKAGTCCYYELGISRYLANGSLDPGFGEGGKIHLELSDVSNNLGLIELANGKILSVIVQRLYDKPVKKLTLIRMHADGAPDESFGPNGIRSSDIYNVQAEPTLLQMDANGRLLIGGYKLAGTSTDIFLSRFLATGDLDVSFGNQGAVSFNIAGNEIIQSIGLDKQNRILIASNLSIPDKNLQLALSRLLPDGNIDTTFGNGGHQQTALYEGIFADAMVVSTNGIYVSGAYGKMVSTGWGSYRNYGPMVMRFTAQGSIDTAFGENGFALDPAIERIFIDRPKAPAIRELADGKILVCKRGEGEQIEDAPSQQIRISRYLADGSLDVTFGTGGTAVTTYFTGYAAYRNLAIQPDGKVVATGTSVWDEVDPYDRSYDLVVARYHTNGSLDSSFGEHGKVIANPGGYFVSEFGEGILVQPDGKIVVGGQRVFDSDGPEDRMLMAIRYEPNGSLDPTFGTGGVAYLTPSKSWKHLPEPTLGLVQRANGFLLGDAFFRVVGILANGTLDSSFGINGIAQLPATAYPNAQKRSYAFCLQPSGKVLLAGEALQLGAQRPPQMVIRYHEDGTIDTSFGSRGIPQANAGIPELSAITALALQQDGSILAAGHQTNLSATTHLILLRLHADGSVDSSFNNGYTILPVSGKGVPKSIQVQADGKIVVAVEHNFTPAFGPEQTEMVLYRFLPNGMPDVNFGIAGKLHYSIWNSTTGINAALLAEGRLYTAGFNIFGTRNTYGLVTAHQMDSGPAGFGLGNFTLVDAATNQDLRNLHNNDTINLAETRSRRFNIRINAGNQNPGSVVMELSGAENRKQIENIPPFALFGNTGNIYAPWQPATGQYTLKATPYSGARGTGTAGKPVSIQFYVEDSLTLSCFTLINARTDQPLHQLSDGAVIDLAQTPAINLTAEPGKGFIGSVRFALNNRFNYRTENKAPYAIAPNKPGMFTWWNIQPGNYTLTATPYSGTYARGFMGRAITIHFTVIRSAAVPAGIAAANRMDHNPEGREPVFALLSNPVQTSTRLVLWLPYSTRITITLHDLNGRILQQVYRGSAMAGSLYQYHIPVSGLAPGVYLVTATDASGGKYQQKLVKQ